MKNITDANLLYEIETTGREPESLEAKIEEIDTPTETTNERLALEEKTQPEVDHAEEQSVLFLVDKKREKGDYEAVIRLYATIGREIHPDELLAMAELHLSEGSYEKAKHAYELAGAELSRDQLETLFELLIERPFKESYPPTDLWSAHKIANELGDRELLMRVADKALTRGGGYGASNLAIRIYQNLGANDRLIEWADASVEKGNMVSLPGAMSLYKIAGCQEKMELVFSKILAEGNLEQAKYAAAQLDKELSVEEIKEIAKRYEAKGNLLAARTAYLEAGEDLSIIQLAELMDEQECLRSNSFGSHDPQNYHRLLIDELRQAMREKATAESLIEVADHLGLKGKHAKSYFEVRLWAYSEAGARDKIDEMGQQIETEGDLLDGFSVVSRPYDYEKASIAYKATGNIEALNRLAEKTLATGDCSMSLSIVRGTVLQKPGSDILLRIAQRSVDNEDKGQLTLSDYSRALECYQLAGATNEAIDLIKQMLNSRSPWVPNEFDSAFTNLISKTYAALSVNDQFINDALAKIADKYRHLWFEAFRFENDMLEIYLTMVTANKDRSKVLEAANFLQDEGYEDKIVLRVYRAVLALGEPTG